MVKDGSKACMFQACLLGDKFTIVLTCTTTYGFVLTCTVTYGFFVILKGCYGSKHVSQKIASRGQSCKLL